MVTVLFFFLLKKKTSIWVILHPLREEDKDLLEAVTYNIYFSQLFLSLSSTGVFLTI